MALVNPPEFARHPLEADFENTATQHPLCPDATLRTELPALEARGFSFAYPEEGTILGSVNWTVVEGAFQLLVGATGSGKTTLLRCCKPAIAPAGTALGELLLEGRPVASLTEREAVATVGYVAQSPDNQIVCDSVWHEMAFGLENLGTPPAEMRRRVAEVAHFFAMESWFHCSCDTLSGGQKQLLTLASALALRPRVLLLDEPTASLDPVAEKNFLHGLFRVNRELGITVVVATHAPEAMVDYATDAVRLEDGLLHPVPLGELRGRPLVLGERPQRKQSAGKHPIREAHPAKDSRPSREARGSASRCPVEARDLFVRYERREPWVLAGCDMALAAGTITALVGGNGCGKSTLLKAIAGTLRPERGTLRNDLARSQGFLPQDPQALFTADSVREELQEWQRSAGYSDEAIAEALATVGLAGFEGRHPLDLSGGQQQLLAFAKVMLTGPRLLLLDEPTKGLDGAACAVLARQLSDFAAQGGTVAMATHDLPFAALLSDRVTLLFDGAVAASLPVTDFFRDNLFYRPRENAFSRLWQGTRP